MNTITWNTPHHSIGCGSLAAVDLWKRVPRRPGLRRKKRWKHGVRRKRTQDGGTARLLRQSPIHCRSPHSGSMRVSCGRRCNTGRRGVPLNDEVLLVKQCLPYHTYARSCGMSSPQPLIESTLSPVMQPRGVSGEEGPGRKIIERESPSKKICGGRETLSTTNKIPFRLLQYHVAHFWECLHLG